MRNSNHAREEWSAWRINDNEVRVQINYPEMARAFAKVKTVHPAGYSVAGNFLRLFHTRQTVPWVESWVKEYKSSLNVEALEGKEN